MGIVEVQAGSPAELAGLAPGMVIVQADGYDVFEQDIMNSIIQDSTGVLNLAVIAGDDEQLVGINVTMQKLVSRGF